MGAERRIKVHIKNNHASPDTFPPTVEGEAVFTITRERWEAEVARYPDLAGRLDAFIDWDLDHFEESMRSAEVLVTWDLPTEDLARIAPRLRWIHIIGAGVEHLCPMDWLPPGVTVVNNRGAHAAKGGEFGLMAMLMLHNHLLPILANQRRRHWESLFSTPVAGKTLLDRRNRPHRARRRPPLQGAGPPRDRGEPPRRGRSTRWTRCTPPVAELDRVLPRADFVFVAIPLTAGDPQPPRPPPPGSPQAGRGTSSTSAAPATMDYDALADHLRSGHLSGAIIDVFDPEPLPPDSELWEVPNLLVTPHVSADDGNTYVAMTLELVFRNMRRYLAGEPLENVVRPELGY